MKYNRLFPLASLIIGTVLVSITGCKNQQNDSTTEVAVPVSVKDVRPGSIEEFIETNGTVYPTQEVELMTEMAGKYHLQKNPRTGMKWRLGDRIKKNEVIIKLEDQEYLNNIQIDVKQLNLKISKSEYDKQKILQEKGGATDRDVVNAEQAWITARYTLENANLQLLKMDVKAPFDGVVVDIPYFTEGNQVNSGIMVAKIMDYKELYMEFQLPEKNLARIKVNQSVRVLNYALPDDTLYGKISQLSPAISPDTRNFKGVLTISNNNLRLRPGSYIKAEIVTQKKEGVIVISKDMILSRQRGKTVFVIDRNTAYERVIKTGLENPGFVEVTDGLRLNDRVVSKGFETLSNRTKVKIIQ